MRRLEIQLSDEVYKSLQQWALNHDVKVTKAVCGAIDNLLGQTPASSSAPYKRTGVLHPPTPATTNGEQELTYEDTEE